jgi:hypothetical protein
VDNNEEEEEAEAERENGTTTTTSTAGRRASTLAHQCTTMLSRQQWPYVGSMNHMHCINK